MSQNQKKDSKFYLLCLHFIDIIILLPTSIPIKKIKLFWIFLVDVVVDSHIKIGIEFE
jgi:hypothetical protein